MTEFIAIIFFVAANGVFDRPPEYVPQIMSLDQCVNVVKKRMEEVKGTAGRVHGRCIDVTVKDQTQGTPS